ncbi:hypothetical protein [Brevundimonas variabilis]|uniref:Uncharacterized protein n=1 Tax=Brevundimonas variabilis TaxID=74312 RepID=A0A7W9CGI3_9CAUL|nr:hypothetical protein [Brevundimonas variabilis]MBB5745215.1 hypothetical protein [Brevundimonas variabilis]
MIDRLSILPSVEGYIAGCPDRYFVSLTSGRRLDPLAFSSEVSKTLHRVNGALFGTHYKRGRKAMLATLAVQELTYDQGIHTHLIVGVPEGSLTLKANRCRIAISDLIVNTWVAGDPQHRRANGQDVRDVYDFSGVRRYIYKGIRADADCDNLDVHNTIIPCL